MRALVRRVLVTTLWGRRDTIAAMTKTAAILIAVAVAACAEPEPAEPSMFGIWEFSLGGECGERTEQVKIEQTDPDNPQLAFVFWLPYMTGGGTVYDGGPMLEFSTQRPGEFGTDRISGSIILTDPPIATITLEIAGELGGCTNGPEQIVPVKVSEE